MTADYTAREAVAGVTQPARSMPRITRNPNTQTPEDRVLWQQIRQAIAQRRREKRLHYGLRVESGSKHSLPATRTADKRSTLVQKSSLFSQPDRSPLGVRGEQLPAQRTKHLPIHPRRPHRTVEVVVSIPERRADHPCRLPGTRLKQTAMQSLTTFNSCTPTFVDACAAVKLVLKEPGSENASENLLKYFKPAGRYFITSFCLFEALGVLKRKMLNDQIAFDHYLNHCWLLLNYVDTNSLEIHDEPKISSFDTFMRAKPIAERYSLDLSDALQLVSLKHGPFSYYVQESTPLLVTVDDKLEKAARSEGLLVWNCQKEATPPERLRP